MFNHIFPICRLLAILTLFAPAVSAQEPGTLDPAIFGYDAWPEDVKVTLADEKHFGKITRQHLVIAMPFEEPVPFYLAYPTGKKVKSVVFLLHGITSSKDIWWQGSGPYSIVREYREALLDAGYAVVAVDARLHGQRAPATGYRSPKDLAVRQKAFGMRDLVVGSVIDFRRVADYLQTRDEFKSAHFGSLGISLGAIHTIAFAAADPRIEFIVPVFPPPMAPPPAWNIFPMGIAPYVKADTLLLLADKDDYYTLEEGEALFAKLASAEKQLLILNSHHDPDVTETAKVMQWIKQR